MFSIASTQPTIKPKFWLGQISRYNDKLLNARFGARTLGDTLPDRPWGPSSHHLQGESFRGVAWITHPHLGPRLKMSIATRVLPLCACMARYRETFILAKLFRHHVNDISRKCIKFTKKTVKKNNGVRNEAKIKTHIVKGCNKVR